MKTTGNTDGMKIPQTCRQGIVCTASIKQNERYKISGCHNSIHKYSHRHISSPKCRCLFNSRHGQEKVVSSKRKILKQYR